MAEINEFQKAWTRPITQEEWDAIWRKPEDKQDDKKQDSGS